MRKCNQTVGFPAVPCMNKATGYTKSDPMRFLCDYHRRIHEDFHNTKTLDLPPDPEIDRGLTNSDI